MHMYRYIIQIYVNMYIDAYIVCAETNPIFIYRHIFVYAYKYIVIILYITLFTENQIKI